MTPPPNGDVHPLWIDSLEQVVALCETVRAAGILALDTEADSFHSYHHKLCLVQVSSRNIHALLDPLRLGAQGLAPLTHILADPSYRKILHGADYDLRILDRDLGVRVRGLADTQAAAQLLGEPRTGLAALVEQELGLRLDKELQRADWALRPLPPAYQAYAAADTAYLEPLLARLVARLEQLGRREWWEEECLGLEEIRWEPPRTDEFDFERVKGARRLKGAVRDRLAALYAWREEVAAAVDVAPFKILSGEVMLRLAREAPVDMAALGKVTGVGRATVRRYGAKLLELLQHPPPAPQREVKPRPAVDRLFEQRVGEARAVRDACAQELGLAPGVLAPRERLEEVARSLPASEEELAGCLQRRWRAAVLAAPLLRLTRTWRGEGAGGAAPGN